MGVGFADDGPEFFGELGGVLAVTAALGFAAEAVFELLDEVEDWFADAVVFGLVFGFVFGVEVVDFFEVVKELLVLGDHFLEVLLVFGGHMVIAI